MGSRLLRRDFRQSSTQIFAMYRTWRQTANNRSPLVYFQSRFNTRHMSVFSEISKRVKGEVESNPELQKSIKELKEKAGEIKAITEDLKERHRDTTKGGPDFGRDGNVPNAERSRQQSICTSMLMRCERRQRPKQSRLGMVYA